MVGSNVYRCSGYSNGKEPFAFFTLPQSPLKTNMSKVHQISYSERARAHTNPAAKELLETMERKHSNLCLSIDVTKKADLLRIVDVVGPHICLLKVGFDEDTMHHQPHQFNNTILTRRTLTL